MPNQGSDKEMARILSNPENLIISEALLERLPEAVEPNHQKCVLKINDFSYSGSCSHINFQKNKANISVEVEFGDEKFRFIDESFPSSLFEKEISIELIGEEKTIVGKLLEISCDLSESSKCIMSLTIYNYQLEVSHG